MVMKDDRVESSRNILQGTMSAVNDGERLHGPSSSRLCFLEYLLIYVAPDGSIELLLSQAKSINKGEEMSYLVGEQIFNLFN